MRNISIIKPLLCSGFLMMLSACGNELDTVAQGENEGNTIVGEGKYVVDYSVSDHDAASTRAYQDNLDTNQRISSLLYLLYDSGGNFVKERRVPGIGTSTKWPLERENMTWEQREALKDTLDTGLGYIALFIANTDTITLSDKTEEEILVYKNAANNTYKPLKDVYIKLPSVPYTDANMPYICKQEIQTVTENETIDRDHPRSYNLTLKRIVSRFDITLKNVTDDDIKSGLDYYYKYSSEKSADNKIKKAVEDALDAFGDKLYKGTAEVGYWINNRNKLQENLKRNFNGKSVYLAVKNDCVNDLVKQCGENGLYKSVTTAWDINAEASFAYTNKINAFYPTDMMVKHIDGIKETKYAVDENSTLSVITFSSSDVQDNSFSSFMVGKANYELVEPYEVRLGYNEMATLECNPIGQISAVNENEKLDFVFTVNMQDIFGDLNSFTSTDNGFYYDKTEIMSPVTQEKMIEGIEEIIRSGSHGSWNAFKLTISLPSLSDDNMQLKSKLQPEQAKKHTTSCIATAN